MRNTKFRGKRSNDGIWIFGDLIKIENSYHILEEGDLVEDGHHIRQDSDRPTWIEPKTLGEFIGLYDSHGTEIYEGDIVKTDYHVGKVVYEEGEWRLYISDNSYKCLSNHIGNGYYIEVIGNIYDNPELLNGEI